MSIPSSRLTASDLVDHPDRLADVDVEHLPEILLKLTTTAAVVAARLQMTPQDKIEGDKLLDVAEVAQRVARSKDWVYRNAKDFPFTKRLNGMLRFSSHGLQRYLDRLPRE